MIFIICCMAACLLRRRGFTDYEPYSFILLASVIYSLVRAPSKQMFVIMLLSCFCIERLRISLIAALSLLFSKNPITAVLRDNIALSPRIIHPERIPKNPVIFLCNYPSCVLEYAAPHYFLYTAGHTKVKTLSGAFPIWVVQRNGKETFNRMAVVPKSGKRSGTSKRLNISKREFKRGYSLLIYPEQCYIDKKSLYDVDDELRTGALVIAEKMNAVVVPICCDRIRHTFGLLDINKTFKMSVGKPISPSSLRTEKSRKEQILKVRAFFKTELGRFSQ